MKILGVKALTGSVFYGAVNKDFTVSKTIENISNENFEKVLLQFLDYRTNNLKDKYNIQIDGNNYQLEITVTKI